MALENLERLLAAVTPEELEVVEQIIASRDEFSVFTNLSRQFATGDSTLNEVPQNPQDTFHRRGLAWVMALARIELATMLVGFSDIKRPLTQIRPTPLELPAYLELLADAARCHNWSLFHDPVAKNPRAAKLSDAQAVAYVRRVHLARSLIAALKTAAGDLAPPQIAEFKKWDQRLAELEFLLLYDVLRLGTRQVDRGSLTRKSRISQELADGSTTVDEQDVDTLPRCVSSALEESRSTRETPQDRYAPGALSGGSQ